MKRSLIVLLLSCLIVVSCGSDGSEDTSGSGGTGGTGETGGTAGSACGSSSTLHSAFAEFGANVDVVLDATDCTVTVEATGKPDHSSPYWDSTGANSALYEAPEDQTAFDTYRSPGDIDEFGTQMYSMTVSATPEKAATSTATRLGAVGIAVSGAPIFNDQEGPSANLQIGVISGFDKNGAHTGPETYHYHLEPKSISNDDSALIGIIADGFFVYGRQCESVGTYPTDLDESGGHTSTTQHSSTPEYHYHVKDEFYLGAYHLLFPNDYQGTATSISR